MGSRAARSGPAAGPRDSTAEEGQLGRGLLDSRSVRLREDTGPQAHRALRVGVEPRCGLPPLLLENGSFPRPSQALPVGGPKSRWRSAAG